MKLRTEIASKPKSVNIFSLDSKKPFKKLDEIICTNLLLQQS